jgi:VanZ family protein
VAAAISLAYACTDEYHQSFVETRHGTPVDVVIDSIGIALAALWLRRARTTRRLRAA